MAFETGSIARRARFGVVFRVEMLGVEALTAAVPALSATSLAAFRHRLGTLSIQQLNLVDPIFAIRCDLTQRIGARPIYRMIMNRKPSMKVCLSFEQREDGGLRVLSSNVPEFFLSHRDYNAVMSDIAPALEVILSDKFHKKVTVTTDMQMIRDSLEDHGIVSPYKLKDGETFVEADFEDA